MNRLDEIYKDVEVGEPSPHIVLFSYGESVPTDQEVDFAQVVERAEQRAKWHHDLIARSAPAAFNVVKRQWWCSDPAQAVVHVYSRDLVGSTVS